MAGMLSPLQATKKTRPLPTSQRSNRLLELRLHKKNNWRQLNFELRAGNPQCCNFRQHHDSRHPLFRHSCIKFPKQQCVKSFDAMAPSGCSWTFSCNSFAGSGDFSHSPRAAIAFKQTQLKWPPSNLSQVLKAVHDTAILCYTLTLRIWRTWSAIISFEHVLDQTWAPI